MTKNAQNLPEICSFLRVFCNLFFCPPTRLRACVFGRFAPFLACCFLWQNYHSPTNISASAQMAHTNRWKTTPNPTHGKACASAGRNNGRPGSPPPPISVSAAVATTPQTGSASCAATANFPPACPCRTAKSNLPASHRKSSACGNVSAATIFSIPTAKATYLSSSAGHFDVQAAFWGKREG